VGYGRLVARTRKLFAALTRRGPHRVLRGDLAFAGLSGVVYTPESGYDLAGIAFGHEWLTGVDRYSGTLEHLASWGIVAAAPDTEKGIAPSVLNLAFDLGTALDIIAGVRLGDGKISVHPDKLGVVGHGFGASAAVFAAAGMPAKPKAVVAAFPTVTKPPAEEAAATLHVPGLVLTAPGDPMTLRSNAVELARVWDGAVLRAVKDAKAGGLIEGRRLARVVGLPGADRTTQKTVRALITGYLLHMLTGDKTYEDFADPEAQLPKTEVTDPHGDPVDIEDKVVALLKP
jgi:pimeloyl-ACP methyl ester carboxylesterase